MPLGVPVWGMGVPLRGVRGVCSGIEGCGQEKKERECQIIYTTGG